MVRIGSHRDKNMDERQGVVRGEAKEVSSTDHAGPRRPHKELVFPSLSTGKLSKHLSKGTVA